VDLINKTIKAHLKEFNIIVKNGFLYKGETAIYTESLKDAEKTLAFLEGISCVLDNKKLWENKRS